MKNFTLLFFVAIITVGCVKMYAISETDFASIPKGSKRVTVTSPLSADSAYKHVSRYFVTNGWIVNGNKEMMQISIDPRSIGAGTMLRPVVFVEPNGTGSFVHYRGEWGLDQQGQIMLQSFARGYNTTALQPIVFEKKGTTKADAAFQALVVYAKRVPGEITYSK
ncbi:hypothetical protein [Dyadobacter sp. CY343]|uniref:hypothetical protein n=1 Tax=Dyadobacter sp. CY343 TaxID=2907299 RepID=UPI001F2E48E9|nr:hypothetical protein [Dyadobacter sp. CY343]MCE7062177.1 hypothetical protein [Dyadobacter sp. CY343]